MYKYYDTWCNDSILGKRTGEAERKRVQRLERRGNQKMKMRRALSAAAVVAVAIVLLEGGECRASEPRRGSSLGASCSTAQMGKCVIDGEESELMMGTDSISSRMVAEFITFRPTQKAGIAYQPVTNCGRYSPYISCLPSKNLPKKGENCGNIYQFNRACPRRKQNNMEDNAKRSLCASMVVMFMISATFQCCRAYSATSDDADTRSCSLISDNAEAEFLMESQSTARLLFFYEKTVTSGTGNPYNPVFACGRGQPSRSCIQTDPNNSKGRDNCAASSQLPTVQEENKKLNMADNARRSLCALIAVILMLSSATHGRAYSATSNATGTSLIISDNAEVEFLMESQSAAGFFFPFKKLPIISRTGNRLKPVIDCGRGRPNRACTPDPNQSKRRDNCAGYYNRACRK